MSRKSSQISLARLRNILGHSYPWWEYVRSALDLNESMNQRWMRLVGILYVLDLFAIQPICYHVKTRITS